MSRTLVVCPYCNDWILDTEATCNNCVEKQLIDETICDLLNNVLDLTTFTKDKAHLRYRYPNLLKIKKDLDKLLEELS